MYNDEHPRGRKFTSEELKMHRDKWIELCQNSPQLFVHAPKYTDSGPLSSLIAELEFNRRCSRLFESHFETSQFQRAMSDGILSLVNDDLHNMIMDTYAQLNLVNQRVLRLRRLDESSVEYKYARTGVQSHYQDVESVIGRVRCAIIIMIDMNKIT
jgi:hypothetical protein